MSARVEINTQPPAVVEITDASSGVVVIASEVASPFVTAAQTAAAEAQAARDSLLGVYYGAFASAPAADPLGNPPDVGDLYYDTTASALMVWDGAQWVQYSPVTPAHTHRWSDITNKPTTLSGYGITDAVPSSRLVQAGTGLTGGGDLSADRTIAARTLPQADWDAGTSTTEAVISPVKLAGVLAGQSTGSWEPFGGTGTDPTLWDGAVDGPVTYVFSPTFEAGYDYMVDLFVGADSYPRNVSMSFQWVGDAQPSASLYLGQAGRNTMYVSAQVILLDPMAPTMRHVVLGGSAEVSPGHNQTGGSHLELYSPVLCIPPGSSSAVNQIELIRLQAGGGTIQDYKGIGAWVRLYRRAKNIEA